MDEKLIVGIADMKMAQTEGKLITYALGSCVGICLYDPTIRLAALIHILLPLNMETGRKNPLKYADTAIKETIKQMEIRGASHSRMTAKIAGGAKMFEVPGGGSFGNIGQRNVESVHLLLKRAGIPILKEDVGGTFARTLTFDSATGTVYIHSYGRPNITM